MGRSGAGDGEVKGRGRRSPGSWLLARRPELEISRMAEVPEHRTLASAPRVSSAVGPSQPPPLLSVGYLLQFCLLRAFPEVWRCCVDFKPLLMSSEEREWSLVPVPTWV